jgi:hypothetical protein
VKNIAIMVGDEERRFSAGRLVTEDPGGGQVTWVPADEAGVILEKTIEKAGTYHATDEGAAGYAVVHVKGGGGGMLLLPIKLKPIPPVPLRIRLTLSEGEGNMAIIDTSNAKIEPITPLIPNAWLGFYYADIYIKKDNAAASPTGTFVKGSLSKSSGNYTAAIGITATMTWAGTEIYLATQTDYAPIIKVSGISYEVGDTLALYIGITIEG